MLYKCKISDTSQITYKTQPTSMPHISPHLLLNGSPIYPQLSGPDSPDGGDLRPGGAWALGDGGELRGWRVGQSGSLSPYLPFHIPPPQSPLPVAVCPLPLLPALSLPGFQAHGKRRRSSWAVALEREMDQHCSGRHIIWILRRIFLTFQHRRPNIILSPKKSPLNTLGMERVGAGDGSEDTPAHSKERVGERRRKRL